MKKLYVGGLPYSTTEAQLRELFEAIGEVASAVIISDRETGRSKGFGFVEMTNDDDAEKAIATYGDGNYKLEGRTLVVNEARPMESRNKPSYGGGNGGGSYNRNRY